MKLYEYEGKGLMAEYDIQVPDSFVVKKDGIHTPPVTYPKVMKVQTHSGERARRGLVKTIGSSEEYFAFLNSFFVTDSQDKKNTHVLVEDFIESPQELYLSVSYSTETRSPVLAFSLSGGSNYHSVRIASLNITKDILDEENISHWAPILGTYAENQEMRTVLSSIWRLFLEKHALLVEINPLFVTKNGFVAGDAKIILDDERISPAERRFITLDGDIAILASGGGASLLSIDTLIRAGGRPANYTEYSGNPSREVVKDITKRVLSQEGLNGCWVVGGTANFTDIYETLSGFIDGVREMELKPTYPIIVRRDGPRRDEAFALLRDFAELENIHIETHDNTTSIEESAHRIVNAAYGNSN